MSTDDGVYNHSSWTCFKTDINLLSFKCMFIGRRFVGIPFFEYWASPHYNSGALPMN